MHEEDKEITREEIKKEFQLERMILFSDAVFAIVITLMAIEIRMPESEGKLTTVLLAEALKHLLPTLFAYIASFAFIGAIWYQHLQLFGLLKDYDKGLVIRNLVLLFFIGLFPFSASVITKIHGAGAMPALFLYVFVILCCIVSQYVLYHYIVVKRPALRINVNIEYHKAELRKRKIAVIGFSAAAVLVTVSYILIPDPNMKGMATLWMMVFPVVYRIMNKNKKKK